jgi:hypothetical protein
MSNPLATNYFAVCFFQSFLMSDEIRDTAGARTVT